MDIPTFTKLLLPRILNDYDPDAWSGLLTNTVAGDTNTAPGLGSTMTAVGLSRAPKLKNQ